MARGDLASDSFSDLPSDREAVEVAPVRAALGEVEVERLCAEAPVVLAVLRTVCRDEAEADDVLAATLEIATRRWIDLRDPAALRPWLIRIATREAFRLRRRLLRFVRLDQVRERDAFAGDPGSDSLAVSAALDTLPPRVRLAVVLHHLVGLSVAEAAAALGTSENTVKTQLRIGLARLRKELGDG